MKSNTVYIGKTASQNEHKKVQGGIIKIAGENYFKISNYDMMPPFLMNIVSDSDLWMFLSSNGALTAGRSNPDNSLFPYYTDDKIYDSREETGNKTILLVTRDDKTFLWEPFSLRQQNIYKTEKNIYKNIIGNQVIFEEINHDLKVSFKYAWLPAERFGFIKKSTIVNNDEIPVKIEIVDGIQNILPSGVERKFQLEYSTLADGYKKNELLEPAKIGLYALSSLPTDKAEPSESLKVTTVWSTGLEAFDVQISSLQLDSFRSGNAISQETRVNGQRGSYLVHSTFDLEQGQQKEWYIIAELNMTQSDVAKIVHMLTANKSLVQHLEEEIANSSENLKIIIAKGDGFQLTEDSLNTSRHLSNTLFNLMRGGVVDNNYLINKTDFQPFLQSVNKKMAAKHNHIFADLPEQFPREDLIKLAEEVKDPDFQKICYEYLPLTFSRRHGDPSRPWNLFSINLWDEHGYKILNYQGNWRDIFQNWEALALSFPEFIENMITKFVNASTADGYNPYRVMKDGFDWEEMDPEDSFSYIGYWGDHQIIYLLKLLELSHKYHPEKLQDLMHKEFFAYANVPYKIKSYQDTVKDPQNTIDFDDSLNSELQSRVDKYGNDGKFMWVAEGTMYHVNLAEKLLIPLLVKFSNFIPEAGIWMNTQRPEWNDANNALVGNGASMVTLYYLRRYITFFQILINDLQSATIEISAEVFELFTKLFGALRESQDILKNGVSDKDRKTLLDKLGGAGSEHRQRIYKNGFSGIKKQLDAARLSEFFEIGLNYLDHSIRANKREDDLYHAYNLISFNDQQEVSIRHLYEMLEGQVAILSSGYLQVEDAILLLKSLRKSVLYRKDQDSYLLYPNRELTPFAEKNIIPKNLVEQSELFKMMIAQKDTSVIEKDIAGNIHFNAEFRNKGFLKETLDGLQSYEQKLIADETKLILNMYEEVFDHKSFTGRSGTFYKYEGLGSIYWHMVSKLLVAIQETFFHALETGTSPSILAKLKTYYYDVRQGIGSHKSPDLYGAFPTDPYSHTPENSGALQPGLTGQVKEDFIARFGEMGVLVNEGKIRFNAALLNPNEFLEKSQLFVYYDVSAKKQTLMLNKGMLAFTICQVPVTYIMAKEDKIIYTTLEGKEEEISGLEIPAELSKSIFRREDKVRKISVLIDL